MSMNIEEFNNLLNSKEQDSQLLTAVCQLTNVEEPTDIAEVTENASASWYGWS